MAEESARCLAGIIRLFFIVFFCLTAVFQRSILKLPVEQYSVFIDYKLTKLERGSQQTPYTRFCLKLFTKTR